MTLNQKLVDFVNSEKQPAWYREVARGLLGNGEVYDSEVSDLAERILAGERDFGDEISLQDIPGDGDLHGRVILDRIEDVSGVNALASESPLTFGKSGITIIYGDNGSGKSGYARILRRAVGSIDSKADHVILPNAFNKVVGNPEANLFFNYGGNDDSWGLKETPVEKLNLVRFYDRGCGQLYVSKDSEVQYQPFAVTLLIQLSEVCDRVRSELERRSKEIQANNTLDIDLPDGSKAFSFVTALSHETDLAARKKDWQFDDSDSEQLSKLVSELAETKKLNPAKWKQHLKDLAGSVGQTSTKIKELSIYTSAESVSKAKKLQENLESAERVSKTAADMGFKGEPLDGVGTETWRALWGAAERYAAEELGHKEHLPHAEGDRCVLCQQPLSPDGVNRLERFYAFINDDSAEKLAQAKRDRSDYLEELKNLAATKDKTVLFIFEALSGLEDELREKLKTTVESQITAIKERIKFFEEGESAEELTVILADDLITILGEKTQRIQQMASEVDEDSFSAKLQDIQSKHDELEARRKIVDSWQSVERYVKNLKQLSLLEAANKKTNTNNISRLKNQLTEEIAATEIQQQFTKLAEKLEVVDYAEMRKRRAKKDAGYVHRPSLVGATVEAEVSQVLSEGEQTALGLAGFLTEALYTPGNSALIFDDPVTSMDARRRRRVADLLLNLAVDRQIIVFTHDAAFLADFYRQLRSLVDKPEVTYRTIQRKGRMPGSIADDLPWDKKNAGSRIQEMREAIARLRNQKEDLLEEQYFDEVRKIAGRMSKTWERAVVDHLVYPVSNPGKLEVQPGLLKIYPKFTDKDFQEFNLGYDFCSGLADRHDNSAYSNVQAPTIGKLENEINRLNDWVKKIKKYEN